MTKTQRKLHPSHRGTLVWQPLDGIAPPHNIHERDAWNFSYPPAQFAIASSDNVALVRGHTLDKAVVGVRASVRAR